MSEISVKVDIAEAERWVKKLGGSGKVFIGKALRAVGSKGVSAVKKGYRSELKKRTGTLYRGVKSSLARDKMSVSVYSIARNEKVRYGFTLAKGAKIKPRNSKVLVFTNQAGETVFTRGEVTIEPRDWFEQYVNRYATSPEFHATVQKVLDKEMARLSK